MDNAVGSLGLVSVNWHLWPWCNYRCKFCFDTFSKKKGTLSKERALLVPGLLADSGTKKISFAGGEPTLCPYLGDLLQEAKDKGLTTMVISNGTGLTPRFLQKFHRWIDWVTLSIDSQSSGTLVALGRGSGSHLEKIGYK